MKSDRDKRPPRSGRAAMAVAAAIAAALASQVAEAETYYWDTISANSGLGGSGSWTVSNSNSNWTTNSAGSGPNTNWTSTINTGAHTAVFDGSGGSVTISSLSTNYTPAAVSLNAAGYVFTSPTGITNSARPVVGGDWTLGTGVTLWTFFAGSETTSRYVRLSGSNFSGPTGTKIVINANQTAGYVNQINFSSTSLNMPFAVEVVGEGRGGIAVNNSTFTSSITAAGGANSDLWISAAASNGTTNFSGRIVNTSGIVSIGHLVDQATANYFGGPNSVTVISNNSINTPNSWAETRVYVGNTGTNNRLRLGATDSLPTASLLSLGHVLGGSIIAPSGSNYTQARFQLFGHSQQLSNITNDLTPQVGNATANFIIENGSTAGNSVDNATSSTLALVGSNTRTFTGQIFNSTAAGAAFNTLKLVRAGTGTTVLGDTSITDNSGINSYANTYTGGTDITGGRLVAAKNSALGTGLVSIAGGTLVVSANVTNLGSNDVTLSNGVLEHNSTTAFNPTNFTYTGGTIAGSGNIGSAVTFGAGRVVSPGSGLNASKLTFDTSPTLAEGGAYQVQMRNAAGVAGTANGWDLVEINGTLDLSALSNFTIYLSSLSGTDAAGPASNFVPVEGATWQILTATEITGFQAADFIVNASAFTNSMGDYIWELSKSGNSLYATIAVPEPGSLSLLALGGTAMLTRRRRR